MGNRFSVPGADQQTGGSGNAFLHLPPGDKQRATIFPQVYCCLLTLPCTSPAPLAVASEETVIQPTSAFLQAFSTFPTSPPQLEEAKQHREIPVLPTHTLGQAVTNLNLSKAFPFFLVFFLTSFFSSQILINLVGIISTEHDLKQDYHIYYYYYIIFTTISKYSSGEKQAEEEE